MKKQTHKTASDGVSPVVGVMLMLVVTIVIAAMVAAFAGSAAGDRAVTPQAAFDVSYTANIIDTNKENSEPDYRAGYKPNNGLSFRLVGGDPLSLENLAIQLKSGDSQITFDSRVYRNESSTVVDSTGLDIITDSSGTNETYLAVPKGQDFTISIGETFMLLVDEYYDNTLDTSAGTKGRFLVWSPEGGGTFKVQVNVPFEYVIIDKQTGGRIQSGTITMR